MTKCFHSLRNREPLRKRKTYLSVATQIASRRQHQVAQARQAHECFGLRTQGNAKARNFCQTSGNQCGTGIEPQFQAIAQACSNGQDVFNGTTHFDTHDICIGIDPQIATVECLYQGLSYRGMGASCYQGSGLLHRHFLGKTRSTQNTAQQLWCDLGTHFVPHTRETIRTCLKSFTQPHHGHSGLHPRRHVSENLPQGAHRRGNDHQVHVLQPSTQRRCGDCEAVAKRAMGQVACVHPIQLHGLRLGFITRP